MAETARQKATYADLAALPEDLTGEIIGGELFATPRPAAHHAIVTSSLGMDLGPPFHGVVQAWLIHPEQETLEVFRLAEGRWVLVGTYEGDTDVKASPSTPYR